MFRVDRTEDRVIIHWETGALVKGEAKNRVGNANPDQDVADASSKRMGYLDEEHTYCSLAGEWTKLIDRW
ncbi:hypothetical protein Tco_0489002 [Tanacetum coccineum]